jgi:hypothetical protein
MSGLVFDAAYPPPTTPDNAEGVLGYIGGPRATHVWAPAQWLPFQHLRQFPCYVPDLSMSPTGQAGDALERAERLGWAPHMPADQTRVMICDLEAEAEPDWYADWAETIRAGGFAPVAYGSLSTVLGNHATDVLAADWDGIPAIPAGSTLRGVQYRANVAYAGTEVDLSVFDGWLMARGGVGPRHGA